MRTEPMCNAVLMRDACTATKLPPTPKGKTFEKSFKKLKQTINHWLKDRNAPESAHRLFENEAASAADHHRCEDLKSKDVLLTKFDHKITGVQPSSSTTFVCASVAAKYINPGVVKTNVSTTSAFTQPTSVSLHQRKIVPKSANTPNVVCRRVLCAWLLS